MSDEPLAPNVDLTLQHWEIAQHLLAEMPLVDCERLRIDLRKEFQRATGNQLTDLSKWVNLTTAQVGEEINYSERQARRFLNGGVIKASKNEAGVWRCLRSDIEKIRRK